jgi:hypothetical protein
MTQTLLSSWNYVFSCREEREDAALEGFYRTLRREKSEPSEAMLSGRAFEDEVYKVVAGLPREPHPKWEPGILAVAEVLKGSQTQVKLSRETDIAGRTYLLYGILDALKAGVIYDVKFTVKSIASSSSSYEVGKYFNSAQHSAYLALLPEAHEFRYLVSDGTDTAFETYNRRNTRPIENIITEFAASLEAMGLTDVYEKHWRTNDG